MKAYTADSPKPLTKAQKERPATLIQSGARRWLSCRRLTDARTEREWWRGRLPCLRWDPISGAFFADAGSADGNRDRFVAPSDGNGAVPCVLNRTATIPQGRDGGGAYDGCELLLVVLGSRFVVDDDGAGKGGFTVAEALYVPEEDVEALRNKREEAHAYVTQDITEDQKLITVHSSRVACC